MRIAAVSVDEERQLELRNRVSGWKGGALLSDEEAARLLAAIPTPWRVSGIAGRIVSFGLSVLLVVAAFWFFDLLNLPKGFLAALLAVGAAEYLIRSRKLLRTGIEEGLYIAGLYAFIFGLPGEGAPEAMLLFVAASSIAALRLRQPLFAVVALVQLVAYVIWRADKANIGELNIGLLVAALTLLCSVVALRLSRRLWESPAVDAVFAIIVAVAPVATYSALMAGYGGEKVPVVFGALLVAYGAILFFVGIRERMHAPLVGAALLVGVIAFDLGARMPLLREWKLIGGGIVLLAATLVAERRLRGRRRGLTSDALESIRDQEVLDMAAAAALAPHGRPHTPEQPEPSPEVTESSDSSSSSFGGGGSTGGY